MILNTTSLQHFRFISTTLSFFFFLFFSLFLQNHQIATAVGMQSSSVISISPSFTGNSSNNNLADIAARVVEEFRKENGHDEDDDIYNFPDDDNQYDIPVDGEVDDTRTEKLKENEEESDEDGEFEFKPFDSSSVSADEIFSNGEILPRYPLFDRSLLLDDFTGFDKFADKSETNSKPSPVVRVPLRKLFSEERDSPSCSSSEADDLDGLAPGTYCIWKPKAESPERCKKSNSTGNTSKRWKFRNLLHRSNSDRNFSAGKDAPVVVYSPLTTTKMKTEKVKKGEKTAKVAVADDDGEPAPVTYENKSTNKTNKGGNHLQSYLPYKQDLFGVIGNVNGLGRKLHPF